jgi:uncharacterized protein
MEGSRKKRLCAKKEEKRKIDGRGKNMNFLIGSDIHGSKKYAELFFAKDKLYNPERIIVLGDFFYNGARNLPPEEYSPKEVVAIVNSYAHKLIAIKGNCDSEVDQMVADFPISENATVFAFGKTITLTHGHKSSFDNLPKNPGDIFVQGHTHIGVLQRKDKIILANPGSISLPKDAHHSYMVMSEKGICLYDLLSDKQIASLLLDE